LNLILTKYFTGFKPDIKFIMEQSEYCWVRKCVTFIYISLMTTFVVNGENHHANYVEFVTTSHAFLASILVIPLNSSSLTLQRAFVEQVI